VSVGDLGEPGGERDGSCRVEGCDRPERLRRELAEVVEEVGEAPFVDGDRGHQDCARQSAAGDGGGRPAAIAQGVEETGGVPGRDDLYLGVTSGDPGVQHQAEQCAQAHPDRIGDQGAG
jgi:hypothetical protein